MGIQLTGQWAQLRQATSVFKAVAVENNVDQELGEIARDLGWKAGARAPVETGYLASTLRSGARKQEHLDWVVVEDIYDKIPYLWRQNFEHSSKRYFFTTTFNEVQATIGDRVQRAVNRSW